MSIHLFFVMAGFCVLLRFWREEFGDGDDCGRVRFSTSNLASSDASIGKSNGSDRVSRRRDSDGEQATGVALEQGNLIRQRWRVPW